MFTTQRTAGRSPASLAIALAVALIVSLLASVPASAAPAPKDPLRGSKLLPSGGRVDVILGQDGGTLSEFKTAVLDVDRRHPRPTGVSLFVSVNGITPLNGLWSPVDYQVGRTQFEEVLSEYGGALTIGVELIDYSQDLNSPDRNLTSRAIAGDPSVDPEVVERYRQWVDELILYSKATKRDVFLKIGYEFDGHWNSYEPESYKAAFRHISQRIDDLRANNVATVWQSATWAAEIPEDKVLPHEIYEAARAVEADTDAHWELWYPGDDAVDWMGISQFATEFYDRSAWNCERTADQLVVPPRDVQNHFLDFARAHTKPVMIAEAAPQGYDLGELTASCIFREGEAWANKTPVTVDQIWDEWYQPTFDFIEANRDVIRSITFINTDWDNQGNWVCTGPSSCNTGYWGDSRLEANPEILARVKAELSDRKLYTRGPFRGRAFEGPDFSRGRGVYEAEYAEADTWLDCCGLGGLPQVQTAASNGREVMVMNFGDGGAGTYGIDFERVRKGSGVTVTVAALGPECCGGSGATMSVLVNGTEVGDPVVIPDGGAGAFIDVPYEVDVPHRATVRVQINPNTGGNLIWVDKITITRKNGR